MNWLPSNWGWLIFGGGLLLYWMSRRGYGGHHGHHGRREDAGAHQHGGPSKDQRTATEATSGASHAGHASAGRSHRHGC